MRNGYTREMSEDRCRELLVDPRGETVAAARPAGGDAYAIVEALTHGIESTRVRDGGDLRTVLGAMADQHYMLTTTPWRRCLDRVNNVLGSPIWVFLAFVAAAVGAVASILALIR